MVSAVSEPSDTVIPDELILLGSSELPISGSLFLSEQAVNIAAEIIRAIIIRAFFMTILLYFYVLYLFPLESVQKIELKL